MTIGELIQQQGLTFQVFDMGRRVQLLANEVFAAFEAQLSPYPSPYLKHAWLAVLAWHPEQLAQQQIWFLKLPLDEQNKLEASARDAFLRTVVEQLANAEQAAKDAPFTYKPDAMRMAYFHALALKQLQQPSTDYYQRVQQYLSGDGGFENWQSLGVQGLAEFVVRLDEAQNAAHFARALQRVPLIVRNTLFGFLENQNPSASLSQVIFTLFEQDRTQERQVDDLAAFVRALSHSTDLALRQRFLHEMLQHPLALEVELLAAIESRCWQDLHGKALHLFLENLAANSQGQVVFNTLAVDLLAMPGIRGQFLQLLTSPACSTTLKSSFNALLASLR